MGRDKVIRPYKERGDEIVGPLTLVRGKPLNSELHRPNLTSRNGGAENAGPENAGLKIAGLENVGPEIDECVTDTTARPQYTGAAINIKDYTETVKLQAITRAQNVSSRDMMSDTYEQIPKGRGFGNVDVYVNVNVHVHVTCDQSVRSLHTGST